MKQQLLAAVLFLAAAISPAFAQSLTTLVQFNTSNGSFPESSLYADASGNLYGTTQQGGPNNGAGTVFEVAAGTDALNDLATFDLTNGSGPIAGVIADASGNLYGTTEEGGNLTLNSGYGDGTVFEVAAGTHAITDLATFNGTNGAFPDGRLVADANGNLYGTTSEGGDLALNGGGGDGTVFEIPAGSHTLTTLVTFTGANGVSPYAGLIIDASGNLYGTTYGNTGDGTVFEIAAGTHTVTTLAAFGGSNGQFPFGGLIRDASGNLYGTTREGGANGDGTVFEVAAGTRALTDLVSFNRTDGEYPLCSLLADANGNLYGTTQLGGTNNLGTVFEVAAGTDTLTTLASLDSIAEIPYAGLIADPTGNLYGTTYQGGANDRGTVFELSNSGFVVPEPTSLSLLALAAPALLTRRRMKRASRFGSTQNQLVEGNQT